MQIINTQDTKNIFLDIFYDDIKNATEENNFITVDTEFIREETDIPLLCLIQIATPNHNFIIDPLALDISFLKDIFADDRLLKVFHSASQDIEMLSAFDINVKNIHDTQLYEMVLSCRERISYKALVMKYMDKKLNKSHVISDWSRRPLTKKQLIYSIEDVLYLRDVYKRQRQKLRDLNREGWLQEEMSLLCEKNTQNNSLIDEQKDVDVYGQLLKWRNDRAGEKNIEPESIIKESVIKVICKKGKNFIINMKNSRYIKTRETKEFLAFAEGIVEEGKAIEKTPGKSIIFYILKTILDIVSQENDISPSIIATTADLEQVSNMNVDGKCFCGWRREIFGNYVKDFFEERLSISMKGAEVKLVIADDGKNNE